MFKPKTIFTIVCIVGSLAPLAPFSANPTMAQEFWCEGLDDNGNGEIDEGCPRSCPDPYTSIGPVTIAPAGVGAGSIRIVRTGVGLGAAYADTRSGISQAYFRTTGASGAPITTETILGDGTFPSYSPSPTWKGDGFGVAWVDERDGNPEVYFRVLDSAGGKPVTTSDVKVSSSNGASLNPSVAWNGSEFLVVWDDVKGSNRDIYTRRLDALGSPLAQPKRLMTDGSIQENPSILWDSSQYALIWTDERDGNREIYALRLDSGGGAIGSEVRITNSLGVSENPSIAMIGSGDYAIAWQDNRAGSFEAWYGRWQGPGYATPAGVAVSTGGADALAPSVTTTGLEVLLAWEDHRTVPAEVFIRRLDGNGAALSDEVPLTTGSQASSVSAIWHGAGAAVAYVGDDGGTIRARVVTAGCCQGDQDIDGVRSCEGDCNDATPEQSPALIETCDGLDTNCDTIRDEICRGTCSADAPTPPQQFHPSPELGAGIPRIVWNGAGYGVTWEEAEIVPNVGVLHAPYFRLLNADGVPLTDPIRLPSAGLWGQSPAQVWTGEEYVVAYSQYDETAVRTIAIARIDASGTQIGMPRVVTADPVPPVGHTEPEIAWNGERFGLVFNDWEFENPVADPRTVAFILLDREGRPLSRQRDLAKPPGGDWGFIIADADGFAVTYYEDGELYFRKLDGAGGYASQAQRFTNDSYIQQWPRVERAPWGYGVVWRDKRNSQDDMYYRRLDLNGAPVAPEVNLLDGGGSSIVHSPSIRWIGNEFLLAYSNQQTQIRIARINADGIRTGPDLRIDQGPDNFTKDRPHMAWNGVRPAVVWEDTRATGSDARNLIAFVTCCEDVPVPGSVSGVGWIDKTTLVWSNNGSERYDRVRGDLVSLLNTDGDFTPGVLDCIEDLIGISSSETDTPALAEGMYYLVRGDSVCWTGSYDSGGSGQEPGRDSEIAASANSCP